MKSIRHTQIRDLVNENGQITVTEFNNLLNVSEATIRRDLEELSQIGWIRRTHGGAVRVGRAEKEPPILQQQVKQTNEKLRIGQLAATFVSARQTTFLGSSSTVAAMPSSLTINCNQK